MVSLKHSHLNKASIQEKLSRKAIFFFSSFFFFVCVKKDQELQVNSSWATDEALSEIC